MNKILLKILFVFTLLQSAFGREWSLWDDFASPVTTDAKYITIGGLAASAMVIASKDLNSYQKRESFEEARPFGDYGIVGETLGWGFLNVGYIAYQYYQGKSNESIEGYHASEHMAKATFFAFSWTMLGKSLVKEKRPGYPDDENSFPSGHSAASFAFASVVAARHGWAYGAPSYFVAFFIAMSRINDDFHYLHDTLVGMTIGAAYGWGTYYQYQNNRPYLVYPEPLLDGAKLNVSWSF